LPRSRTGRIKTGRIPGKGNATAAGRKKGVRIGWGTGGRTCWNKNRVQRAEGRHIGAGGSSGRGKRAPIRLKKRTSINISDRKKRGRKGKIGEGQQCLCIGSTEGKADHLAKPGKDGLEGTTQGWNQGERGHMRGGEAPKESERGRVVGKKKGMRKVAEPSMSRQGRVTKRRF